jgi:hypothetical protein
MGAGKIKMGIAVRKSMLKKIYLLFLLLPSFIFPQAEYVPAKDPVYDFLERMETLQLIKHYNPFELPKSRGDVGSYLKEVITNKQKLNIVDQKILEDLEIEFEYEINGTLKSSESLIEENSYSLFGQNEKYLFFYDEPNMANIFINLITQGEYIHRNNTFLDISSSTSLGYYGGEIRGTLLNKFGFFLRGYQGQVFGNRQTARLKKEVAYNYKYNLEPDEGYFDETSGYISADFDLLKLKFGRDRLIVGYGGIKPIIADNSPMFDYLSLTVKYKFFSFSYFHGKLIGNSFFTFDSVTGEENIVEEKYIGYHRIAFDLSNSVSLGAGEIIIYGDRGIDISYLNPFTFYKSVEHSNKDRDNSMLFFDANIKPVEGLKVFGTLLIDDISFGKIGTGWYGNKILYHTGIFSSNLYEIMPVDLSFEYIRIEPYTLTHRLSRNSFTHDGYNLGSTLDPNSELFFSQINYRFNHRLSFAVSYGYTVHGANSLNPDGSIKVNVGSNINFGHRVGDSESVKFLDGDIEYLRKFSALFLYEPFNQILFKIRLNYFNNSMQNSVRQQETQGFFVVSVRI